MKLIYKLILFCIFLTSSFMNAQEKDSLVFSPHHFNRIQFDLGMNQSFALDGFLQDAYSLKLGSELSADFYVTPNWFIGTKFRLLRTEVEKPEKIGAINKTSIFTLGAETGYVFLLNQRLELSLVAGIGGTDYKHESKFATNFHDNALTVWVQPKIAYRLADFVAIFAGLEYRNDFMNTSVPEKLEDYFNNSPILSPGLGVRFITH